MKDWLKKAGLWTLARAREPSTWAGLGALLIAYHVPHAQDWASVLTNLGAVIGGGAAILLPEGK
jgi:hypothetical protein